MFWGLILKSNKKYTQTLEKSFHLSQASLDHSSSDNEPVQVMYTHDDNSYLLCTLQKGKTYQCPLDLNFQEGDKLCFSTKGNGIVHLTGFLTDEFDGFDDDDMGLDEEEDESETEEVEDLRQKLEAGKKKQKGGKEEAVAAKKKQAKPETDSDEDENDSEQEDDDSDDDAEPNETAEQESEDDSDESEDNEDEESEDETPAPPAKQAKLDQQAQINGKKQKQQKNGLENGDKNQQKQKEQKKKGTEGLIQKLQGGLQVQDLKSGTGAEAKPGKKIQVYYEGRLKSNNKVFDSTKSGPGFKMSLGRGEVIKGWDIGLVGMKVGGKRRLVCPPQLAYGAKGSPPVIPPNSTLVFDVELKNVF